MRNLFLLRFIRTGRRCLEKNLDKQKTLSVEITGFYLRKGVKWYKAHQAIIFFITGIYLPPVRLGHADTKTNLQSEKPWADLKSTAFLV
jgi:hypothetical protein